MTPRPLPRAAGFLSAKLARGAIALALLALVGCGLQPSSRVVQPVGPSLSSNQTPARAAAPVLLAVPAPAEEPIASFEVRAHDLSFDQQSIAVTAPGLYRVRLVNEDEVAHEIAFDDGARLSAGPGESVTALVRIPAAGSAFVCLIPAHRDAGMVGQVTVDQ